MVDRQKAVRARVFGRVQGVGYRDWTRSEATGLGLVGWVRNERDGSVTAWFTGADAAVSIMTGRLWRGPAGAAVSRIDLEEVDTGIVPGDFRIVV